MASLLPVGTVLDATNGTGVCYKNLIRSGNALDIANAIAQGILSTLAADLATTDPAHFAALTPFVTGIYGTAPGSISTSPFGAVSGIGPGSFGTGQGLLNRTSILNGAFFAWIEALRKDMATYGAIYSIVDLSTYAAYQNALTAYSCLYTPDFATLFWYAYNLAQQVAGPAVFAPSGIVMAAFEVTGSDAGVLTPGSFPSVNGYSLAPLAVNCGVITITGADTVSTSGFTGTGSNAVAYVSTAISGGSGSTATLTVTDSNGNTFTANVSALAAGSQAAFTSTKAGTPMATPVSVALSGTATGGVVRIVSGGPTYDTYGNQVWIGGLPMAQGFAPNHSPTVYVSSTTNGTAVLTITAPNQNGVSVTWVTTITGGQSTGYSTPVIVGAGTAWASDRMSGAPTNITVSGAVTSGSVQVLSGLERSY
jgi:hypothetical protein